ncbi:MAG: hypothetical protein KAS72_12985 [Phycisphaerales bacterium]|nr:hypothetical protein [Phycisphaerales bacterium]
MRSDIYRYIFNETVPVEEAEATLHLAILAAESLFGESRVRMDASYTIDESSRVCVIDGSSEVGRSICRIFTGYLIREFGADGFTVRRVAAAPAPRSRTAHASVGAAA